MEIETRKEGTENFKKIRKEQEVIFNLFWGIQELIKSPSKM